MSRSELVGIAGAVWLAVGCGGQAASLETRAETAGGGGSSVAPGTGGALVGSGGSASVPGSPPGMAGAGGSGAGTPGHNEVPGMLPFQGSGTGGASASTGGAGGSGGVPDPGNPPAARRKLRDTPPGEAVVFDPDEVYAVGYVTDGDGYVGPLGIAPLSDTRDTVLALPLFNKAQLRRTDGHLLYSFDAADANGLGYATPLYEFRRDEADLANVTRGEASLADVTAGCAAVPSKTPGYDTFPGQYVVAFDGPLYYSCYERDTPDSNHASWFTAAGAPEPNGPGEVVSIGVNGRALAWTENGGYVVFDLRTGEVFQSHATNELLPSDPPITYALAARAHAGGFWLAGGTVGDEPSEQLTWVNLDATGGIASTGVYAPLPAGVTLASNNWGRAFPVLDGKGAYYQHGFDGDDAVIIRRPMTGESTVAYRTSDHDASNAHQVAPDSLVTGR